MPIKSGETVNSADMMQFMSEHAEQPAGKPLEKWKILIVDDEKEVHDVTRLALGNLSFKGRSLEFLHSYNEQETREMIRENRDIALILLDVVMETDDTGLKIIRYIRETINNNLVRIVIRTGQPGRAPEKKLIMDYDINDYKEKVELTAQRLFSTVIASLRAYDNLMTIEIQKEALEVLFQTAAYLYNQKSPTAFSGNVIACIKDVIKTRRFRLDEYFSGFSAVRKGDDFVIEDIVGEEEGIVNKPVREILPEATLELIEKSLNEARSYYFDSSQYLCFFGHSKTDASLIYLRGKKELMHENRYFINILGSNIIKAYENISLTSEIEETQSEILTILGEVIEKRSNETGSHVQRVAEYSRLVAEKYGLDREEADLIRKASPMHDLGKIGIPDNILNKPAALTPDEFELIKSHAVIGYRLLRNSSRSLMKAAAIIAFQHHEKYNGQGYPRGLKGDEIHIYGRITALADVFDAIGSDRVYKKAWDTEKALAYIRDERGKSFDPDLVDIFFANLDEILSIRDSLTDAAAITET